MEQYLLGIDIGTSSVKAVIINYNGKICGNGQMGYDIHSPRTGWAEQDPRTWWKSLVSAVKDACAKASMTGLYKITGIGLSGQMHSLVVLNEAGEVLRPSIIWADQRSTEEVKEYYERIGMDMMAAITANPVATGFFGPSLLWLKKNEPEVYKQIRWALLPKDYIRYRLTGQIGTEATDASSTLLFHTHKRQWSEELCKKIGLDFFYLPPCSEPWNVAGELTKEAAEVLGLVQGIPVSFGGSDQPMQAIGNGICSQGTVSVTIGTGGQVFTPANKAVYDPMLKTHTFCNALPDSWYVMGGTLSAGLSLKWFSNLFYGNADYSNIDQAAANVTAGSEGLLFLPYLIGERTPHLDPFAKGAFIGLSLRHTQAHLARAVLEGVVFALSETLDIIRRLGLPIEHLIASGGGAYSPLWRQIMADVFDCSIKITNTTEQACIGAALTAGTAIGVYTDMVKACEATIPSPIEMERPNPANVKFYRSYLALYKEAYLANRQLFHKLAEQH